PTGANHHAAPRRALNDTGMVLCVDLATGLQAACAGSGQDGDFGRDVTNNDNSDGLAGFSFKKVCNNGRSAGRPGCSGDAAEGPGPEDWGCTKDLITGLVWA